MTSPQPKNSFSWGDALFLYIERPGQPLSIACVSVFEGNVPLKACRDLVESKLPLIPRYRQHVYFPPLHLGLPTWQFDPNFDIRNHIRQVTLRNGTESDLKALTSKIVSTHLDRQRPLWDITLVRGLEGNRTGMIARLHHCLADGVSGLGIMNVLMETSPVAQPIRRSKMTPPKAQHRDAGAALIDGLLKSYFSAVKGALTLHSEALHIAEGIMASSSEPLSELMTIMPEIAAPADRLPFNVVCYGPQKFGWTEIAMEDVRTIRQHCGGTVNDVILTVMAAAVRRYSELRGVRLKGRAVRMMIPVNIRGDGDITDLGNRISFLPVTIPLDIRDPQKLFAFVRQRTEYLKRVRAAEVVGFAGGLFATLPTAFWAAIGPLASQLPLSLCNTICTNVPGPQMPLYLLGHKMLAWYPYVPIGGELGMNCAILSYNGKAYFGFTCDVGAVPDPENLEKFVDVSFAELCKSAKQVKAPDTTEHEQRAQAVERPPQAVQRAKRKRAGRMIPLSGAKTAKAPRPERNKTEKPPEATAMAIAAPSPESAAPAVAREQTSEPVLAMVGD